MPDDVSLVGFNDTVDAQLLEVPLTTVHYPAKELGTRAAELLERIIDGEPPEQNDQIVPAELVVRSSTTAPKG